MKIRFLFSIFLIFTSIGVTPLDALIADDIPILNCSINRTDKRKCRLAIGMVFRDEADYLIEWIEYHRLVGVNHFYLYNNCSQDAFWEVLKPYVDQGIVELFDVPFDSYRYNDGAKTHNFVQVCCYNHAVSLARGYNEWLAMIDSDEFICPVIDKNIPSALARYGYAGGIAVYWQIYGTSNVWDLQPGELLIEKLLLKAPNIGGNGLFKSIVRPEFVLECNDPHWTKLQDGILFVLPNHQKFSHTPNFAYLPVDVIRINHYTNRTESYYQMHKKPRRARWGELFSPEQERIMLDGNNQEYDPVMLRFVPQLKARLERHTFLKQ
jgi:hypothetical protein